MALKGRRSTPEERLQAVQLLKEGNEAAVVARMFSVSRAILFRWQQKYDQGGPVALETKKTPGPASRLSPTQLSKLYAIITGSDPRQLEFDFGLWTRKIIRELIRREFGVKLSEVQVGRLLNKIGLSPQRPLYRAYQQDPERVEEWKKSAYPKIRKLAAEEGASIFFADEASIRTDHHAGTTWAPVGQTPVVITTGERKSVNMVSAISPRGELRFRVQEGKMNAGKFIDFLRALLDSVPGKIFLIVDGHPVHKAKKVSEFVKEKADGRLSIFFLPPYSPDLNPDEWVWNNVKNDRIGRSVIMSADDLKAKAIGALRRLQKVGIQVPSPSLRINTETAALARASAPRARGSRRAGRWSAAPGLRPPGRSSRGARSHLARLRPAAPPAQNGLVRDPAREPGSRQRRSHDRPGPAGRLRRRASRPRRLRLPRRSHRGRTSVPAGRDGP
jgi:transposase